MEGIYGYDDKRGVQYWSSKSIFMNWRVPQQCQKKNGALKKIEHSKTNFLLKALHVKEQSLNDVFNDGVFGGEWGCQFLNLHKKLIFLLGIKPF